MNNAPTNVEAILRVGLPSQNNVAKNLKHLGELNEGFMYVSTICSNFGLGSFIMNTVENDRELRLKTSDDADFEFLTLLGVQQFFGDSSTS